MASSVDISKFVQSLADYDLKHTEACKIAVAQFSEHCLGEAQLLCPISDPRPTIEGKRGHEIKNPAFTGHAGFLKNSANADNVVQSGLILSMTIGFNTQYAAAVHEVLDAFHPHGEAKFLEKAMQENYPKFPEFLAAKIAEVKN